MPHYTTDQALTNWRVCFDEGLHTAARAWWALVQRSLTAIPDGTQDDDFSDVGPERSGGIWSGRAALATAGEETR